MKNARIVAGVVSKRDEYLPLNSGQLEKELESEFANAPVGKCFCCQAENVRVLTLHNTNSDADTITLCLNCMTGKTPFKPQGPQAN